MYMKFLPAAFLAAALPVVAQAATVTTGSNGAAFTLVPGQQYSETWTTATPFSISEIGYTLIGAGKTTSAVSGNINLVTAGVDGDTSNVWEIVPLQGGKVTIGYTELKSEGFETAGNSSFIITLSYAGTGTSPLQATYAFTATPVVPVPAAGVLLMSAIAGFGVVARRRNKKA
ncbi:MAG TPA: VPLPA-CTERM sorting domain-containing protein [Paenirhodobacter sp.]